MSTTRKNYIIYCILIIINIITKYSSAKRRGLFKKQTSAPDSEGGTELDQLERCYDGLGCVKLTPEWSHPKHRPVNLLPSDRHAVNTIFVHWNYEDGNLTSDIIGDLNIRSCLKLLIHDFTSNGYTGWIRHLARALLSTQPTMGLSVVSVDWAAGAEPPYVQAVANARLVALEISLFLNRLRDKFNLVPDRVHAIGHGLGAHIAGYVGKMNRLKRITALDPSGPHFMHMPPQVRLHKNDAEFVEVVHSDNVPYGQGYTDLLGHVDFYPNGGKQQPGCVDLPLKVTAVRRDSLKLGETLSACSHKRSLKYYIEAHIHPTCSFLGFACPSHKDFLKGKCTSCGEHIEYCARLPSKARFSDINNTVGFHFVTSNSAPFCTETLKVLLVLKSKNSDQDFVKGYFNVTIPQSVGDVTFLLNENHAVSALQTDDHHVFMVFRSVPPPLMLPAGAVHIKWMQGALPSPWANPPKVTGLMVYKMTDMSQTRPQWFCPVTGSTDEPLGLGLEPCEQSVLDNPLNKQDYTTKTYHIQSDFDVNHI